MNKRQLSVLFLIVFILVGCLSLPVFISSFLRDSQTGDMEAFERVARLIGYILVLAISGLSAASACCVIKRGAPGRAAWIALCVGFASTVILCVHDALLFGAYGNQLEGSFTMTAFFAMDIALLALYPVAIYLYRKHPERPLLRGVFAMLALVWLIYMIGDTAGYPVSQLADWDEALISLAPLCNALFLCFSVKWEQAATSSHKG